MRLLGRPLSASEWLLYGYTTSSAGASVQRIRWANSSSDCPRTAAVVLALQDQRRCRGVVACGDGRQPVVAIVILLRLSGHRVGRHVIAGVRGAHVRLDVGDRRSHGRGAKQVAVADRPCREETAVGLAGAGETIVGDAFVLQRADDRFVLRQVQFAQWPRRRRANSRP